jgi:hypothetical protein
VLRGRHPIGYRPQDAGALTGPGPVPHAVPLHSAIPGSGVTLGRAIGRELLQSTMAEGPRVAWTTGHALSTYRGGAIAGPQQFVKLTTQGSPQTKDALANATGRTRIARRALSRNRGFGPGR